MGKSRAQANFKTHYPHPHPQLMYDTLGYDVTEITIPSASVHHLYQVADRALVSFP